MMTLDAENKTQLWKASTIRRIVCEHYKFTVPQLMHKSKPTQDLARAKHVVCYLLIKILGCTGMKAAEMVGRSTPSTAQLSKTTVTDQMSVYPSFKAEVEILEAKCSEAVRTL